MFWETVAAVVLVAGTLPLWLFVAFGWGMLRGAFSLATNAYDVLTNGPLTDVWFVPVAALMEAFSSAWSVPAEIWDWGKYGHPWWAALIGLICLGAASGKVK